jgi:hypothetical protein
LKQHKQQRKNGLLQNEPLNYAACFKLCHTGLRTIRTVIKQRTKKGQGNLPTPQFLSHSPQRSGLPHPLPHSFTGAPKFLAEYTTLLGLTTGAKKKKMLSFRTLPISSIRKQLQSPTLPVTAETT